jgi:hypothetical protein
VDVKMPLGQCGQVAHRYANNGDLAAIDPLLGIRIDLALGDNRSYPRPNDMSRAARPQTRMS